MKGKRNYRKESDRLFSLLVRQSNADEEGIVTCCTCGKTGHWRKFHLGHFMPRQHQATRFDRMNTDVQCVKCNSFNEGEQYAYGKYLDITYGEGSADEIVQKSKTACPRKEIDFKWLVAEFTDELTEKGYLCR